MNNVQADIRYVKRHDLSVEQWDKCVEKAGNGLIYGKTFFLDHMTDRWDGLVCNDYEAVMPLPWRRKGFIDYLYYPALSAQLGLFGQRLSPSLLSAFLHLIPRKFRYWDFPLNHGNCFPIEGFHLYDRCNFVLSLEASYATIHENYRENVKRNIRKALQYGCSIRKNIAIEEVTRLAMSFYSSLQLRDAERFITLYRYLYPQNKAKTYGVYHNEQLVASCAFVFDGTRATYLVVGNHPNGRTLGASHALIDAFISDHAGSDLTLDFEGSDLSGLAFFYSSFGAHEERYMAIRENYLPWPLRFLKR